MRKAFIESLSEIAAKDKRVVLLTADLGFGILDEFSIKYPKQFINVGVAESNLISVAAGLASMGFLPFTYTIANFASMRPFEHIRNLISLQELNVKMLGIGAGLAYNKAGPTHHSIEDIALFRSLPNIDIVNPSDPENMKQAVYALYNSKNATYLRIEKNPDPVDIKYNTNFVLGKGIRIKNGEKMAILCTGTKIPHALNIANLISRKNINPAIYSFTTISPLDKTLLKKIAVKYKYLITLEEHRKTGGFGSSILETVYKINHNILIIGLSSPSFVKTSADYEILIKEYGFDSESIAKTIIKYFDL